MGSNKVNEKKILDLSHDRVSMGEEFIWDDPNVNEKQSARIDKIVWRSIRSAYPSSETNLDILIITLKISFSGEHHPELVHSSHCYKGTSNWNVTFKLDSIHI